MKAAAKDIQKRFFLALDILMESDKIKSLQSFCAKHELHRPKYSSLKNHPDGPSEGKGYKLIDIDALSYVVIDYGISAHWLLTGNGGMFDKPKKGDK